MIQVTVRLFATLRQIAGWKEKAIATTADATVNSLLEQLSNEYPGLNLTTRSLYAAVNQEYAERTRALADGDEVALFPPVSGGSAQKLFEITTAPLSLDDVAQRVTRPDCGAITTFAGIVRGETVTKEGERNTDFLDYEAYTGMAEQMLVRIADEIRAQWPAVKEVSILHRVGRCEIGEASVVIAVATPHRGDGCFEACRYAIERLKAIVPIWKQENWADGQVWIEGPRQPELDLAAPPQMNAQRE
ncbi:MAG: molybdopterin converting factor subunit 1 [Caldilineaceae bacterium]|nr:molybdopterin converting factor subunit 1 [Caldilineaceae bacterium]MCB0144869.1 molybdopterin converting factor subunit 1 [Caldilineaceae bacterium]